MSLELVAKNYGMGFVIKDEKYYHVSLNLKGNEIKYISSSKSEVFIGVAKHGFVPVEEKFDDEKSLMNYMRESREQEAKEVLNKTRKEKNEPEN